MEGQETSLGPKSMQRGHREIVGGRKEYTCWILTHDDDPLRGFEACLHGLDSFIFVLPRFLFVVRAANTV